MLGVHTVLSKSYYSVFEISEVSYIKTDRYCLLWIDYQEPKFATFILMYLAVNGGPVESTWRICSKTFQDAS